MNHRDKWTRAMAALSFRAVKFDYIDQNSIRLVTEGPSRSAIRDLLTQEIIEQLGLRDAGWGDFQFYVNGELLAVYKDRRVYNVIGSGVVEATESEPVPIQKWFKRFTSVEAPPEFLRLESLGKNLFGSPVLKGRKITGLPHQLKFNATENYLAVGHWGYGVNSYAVYVSHVEPRLEIFWSIGCGGVYMSEQETKQAMAEAVKSYQLLLQIHQRGAVVKSYCRMGDGEVVVSAAGREVKFRIMAGGASLVCDLEKFLKNWDDQPPDKSLVS
ncbi:MAG: hypothetical protein HC883_02870 [Bdellovibrionaceae bacterium]|nr:hypothetical protein [Pseudobdellovibrionaceae bacterium]